MGQRSAGFDHGHIRSRPQHRTAGSVDDVGALHARGVDADWRRNLFELPAVPNRRAVAHPALNPLHRATSILPIVRVHAYASEASLRINTSVATRAWSEGLSPRIDNVRMRG